MYYSQSLRGCFLGGAGDLKSQASDMIVCAPPHEPAPHWLAPHNNNFNLTAIAYLSRQLPVQQIGTPHLMEKPKPCFSLDCPALLRIVYITKISPSHKKGLNSLL